MASFDLDKKWSARSNVFTTPETLPVARNAFQGIGAQVQSLSDTAVNRMTPLQTAKQLIKHYYLSNFDWIIRRSAMS